MDGGSFQGAGIDYFTRTGPGSGPDMASAAEAEPVTGRKPARDDAGT